MTDAVKAAWPSGTRRLRIGDITIDLRYQRIERSDGQFELQQRMFHLLMLFAAEPNVLHTRSDLLQRAWPGVIVEDSNLSQAVWLLRKALGDERKDWIRTVAKQGYVFDPPTSVEAVTTEQPSAPVEAAAFEGTHETSVAEADAIATVPQHQWLRRRWWPIAASGALLLAIVTTAALWSSTKPAVLPAPALVSVALIEATDLESPAASRMPAALLRAWMEWKLSALPEIILVTRAHLSADAPTPGPSITVLLVSGYVPNDPGQVFVQARFEDRSGVHRFQAKGKPGQVGALVDEVSQQLTRALAPQRAEEPWPVLQVDAATAQLYSEMLKAREMRDWVKVVNIGRPLVQRAPRFALARLHLAQAYANLSQAPAAQAQMQAARRLLQPSPPDAMKVIDAQALAISPQHEKAAAAYAELSARYPQQPVYALQYARALARAGRSADAVTVLSRPVFQQPQPLPLQISVLINRASAEFSLRNFDAARTSAQQAENLARAAGEGWDLERGLALMELARIDVVSAAGARSSPLYEQAAQHFDRAGDKFSALEAHFLGEVAGPGSDVPPHLDAWLTQTRAAGQSQHELDALRMTAYRHYRGGDIANFRTRLTQASDLADTMNDNWGHAILGLDLLNDAFLRSDLEGVDQRIANLRKRGMQGELALWMDEYEALIALDRGHLQEAKVALDQGEANARAQHANNTAGIFGCTRAGLALTQGQPGEARAHYALCGASDPVNDLAAQIGTAEVELLSGDRDTAMVTLRQVHSKLPSIALEPTRWGLAIDLATQLTRAGDTNTAEELYAQVLTPLHESGYRRMEAFAYVGAAENAVARGEFEVAAQRADAARELLAADNWSPTSRLTLVDVALADSRGDPSAQAMLIALERDAHKRGDVVVQLLASSLIRPSKVNEKRRRSTLVANSGLRGATMDWMAPQNCVRCGKLWTAQNP